MLCHWHPARDDRRGGRNSEEVQSKRLLLCGPLAVNGCTSLIILVSPKICCLGVDVGSFPRFVAPGAVASWSFHSVCHCSLGEVCLHSLVPAGGFAFCFVSVALLCSTQADCSRSWNQRPLGLSYVILPLCYILEWFWGPAHCRGSVAILHKREFKHLIWSQLGTISPLWDKMWDKNNNNQTSPPTRYCL